MADCTCKHTPTTKSERSTLFLALLLNALMFIIGLSAGIYAESSALIADSLDMLADTIVYSLSLIAVGRSSRFKISVAKISGGLLLFLGAGMLLEVIHKGVVGSSPESTIMIGVACGSLIVNTFVLLLLKKFRNSEAHLRAAWIFTRADVLANLSVIISGILITLSNSNYPDLIVGFAIGLYVIKESLEIIRSSINIRFLIGPRF